MSNFWTEKDNLLKRVQALRKARTNVYGDQPVKVPCDDMDTYKIEDCRTCPSPCEDGDIEFATGEE